MIPNSGRQGFGSPTPPEPNVARSRSNSIRQDQMEKQKAELENSGQIRSRSGSMLVSGNNEVLGAGTASSQAALAVVIDMNF